MKKKIPTLGHHAQVTLFGTVDVQTGDVFCSSADKCNAVTFLAFLKELVVRYADKSIILILDVESNRKAMALAKGYGYRQPLP
ncbi:transposase [Aneurinibacillus sp. BA2021]|nr:transposase [Aneurinibacillus sp. BA2021]